MLKPGCYLYRKDIPLSIVKNLDNHVHPLLGSEARMLERLGIHSTPKFARLRMNKKSEISATYSLCISGRKNLKMWGELIGFELERQRRQSKILISANGALNLTEKDSVLYKFYSLFPPHLRLKKKNSINKLLLKEAKGLAVVAHGKKHTIAYNSGFRAHGFRKDDPLGQD
jgi:hypothetical protein